MLFSIAASESLILSSIDIKTAFLYSPIKEVLYLRRPSGLDPSLMPPLVKLNKCIYGLKQAAFEWRLLLDTTLQSIGFIPLKSESLYLICFISLKIKGKNECLATFFGLER